MVRIPNGKLELRIETKRDHSAIHENMILDGETIIGGGIIAPTCGGNSVVVSGAAANFETTDDDIRFTGMDSDLRNRVDPQTGMNTIIAYLQRLLTGYELSIRNSKSGKVFYPEVAGESQQLHFEDIFRLPLLEQLKTIWERVAVASIPHDLSERKTVVASLGESQLRRLSFFMDALAMDIAKSGNFDRSGIVFGVGAHGMNDQLIRMLMAKGFSIDSLESDEIQRKWKEANPDLADHWDKTQLSFYPYGEPAGEYPPERNIMIWSEADGSIPLAEYLAIGGLLVVQTNTPKKSVDKLKADPAWELVFERDVDLDDYLIPADSAELDPDYIEVGSPKVAIFRRRK